MMTAHNDKVRTESQCLRRWHGGANSKGTSLIRCRCNNAAALWASANSHRLASKSRIFNALDGNKKTIQIEMGYMFFLFGQKFLKLEPFHINNFVI